MNQDKINALNSFFLKKVHLRWHDPTWRGVKIAKFPTDIVLYQQEIWKKRPDFMIDSGTRFGGSALFFADMLETIGKGRVISIDIKKRDYPKHPRIQYLTGSSISSEILDQIKEIVGTGSVMVALDSDHTKEYVEKELRCYSPIVTNGQWLVVEDCYGVDGELAGPGEASDWFLKNDTGFIREDVDRQFIIGYSRGGWLRKI
jgi:cephalosporin hydroxylase